MQELAIHIFAISSKRFASQVIAEVISEGKRKYRHTARVFGEVSKAKVKLIAQDVKKKLERNLKQGMRFDGRGPVKPLKKSTIERKKAKGSAQPSRVFYDTGKLFTALKLADLARGYSVTFRNYTYPETNTHIMDVATYLNDGTDNMVARPFFGLTKSDFQKLVDKHIGKERVKTGKVTAKQMIEVRTLVGNVIGVRRRPKEEEAQ